MGPNWPVDWGLVVEAVFPLLLYALVFMIGFQIIASEWLEKPKGPRFPDDPNFV